VSPTVRPIDAAEHLAFVRAQPTVSFLQTPAWGRVKTAWRSESLGWYDGLRLIGAGLVLHRPVPRLRFTLAYLAEGPTIDWTGELGDWLDPLAAYLQERGAFAIRLGPPVRTRVWDAEQVKTGIADPGIRRLGELPGRSDPVGLGVVRRLREAGWRPQSPEAGFGMGHPQYTFEIPLHGPDGRPKTQDQVLAGMNQLWRRNIKKADREGVEVTISTGHGNQAADLAAFHQLYVHTAQRDHFTPRPLSYFHTMLTTMATEDHRRIRLFLAHHDGDLVAATILITLGVHAWYSYGASSTHKREVRGSNALQWAMIRTALTENRQVYDLRGITPTLDTNDPHLGLIQFKVGTGGHAIEHVGEWDLPLRPTLYRAFDLYMRRRARLRQASR
jgi:vancomycin resistance protein VanK